MNKLFSLVVASLVSAPALAGTISGGGGMLMRHSQNPWFLENTSTVKFCMHVAPEFGVAQDRLKQLVTEVVEEWQDAFRSTKADYYSAGEVAPFGQIRIGTQTWTESCDQPDVDFQFGDLTENQRTYFDKVTEYIAASIRTNYDTESLRAKGFVYVAPLVGELKPDTNNIHPEAWSIYDNIVLKIVLRHELGHVFGLQHMERDGTDLMNERLPESMISKDVIAILEKNPLPLLQYLAPRALVTPRIESEFGGCGDHKLFMHEAYYKLMGIEGKPSCIVLKVNKTQNNTEIAFFAGETKDALGKVGELRWYISGAKDSTMLSKVYLPSDQKVFTHFPEEVRDHSWFPLYGSIFNRFEQYHGIYYVEATKEKTMQMSIVFGRGGDVEASAVTTDLRTILNLFY